MFGLKISISLRRIQKHRPNPPCKVFLNSGKREKNSKFNEPYIFILELEWLKEGNTPKVADVFWYFEEYRTKGCPWRKNSIFLWIARECFHKNWGLCLPLSIGQGISAIQKQDFASKYLFNCFFSFSSEGFLPLPWCVCSISRSRLLFLRQSLNILVWLSFLFCEELSNDNFLH